jgi:hypothetical protein
MPLAHTHETRRVEEGRGSHAPLPDDLRRAPMEDPTRIEWLVEYSRFVNCPRSSTLLDGHKPSCVLLSMGFSIQILHRLLEIAGDAARCRRAHLTPDGYAAVQADIATGER